MNSFIRKARPFHAKIIDDEGQLDPIFTEQHLRNGHVLRTIENYTCTLQNNNEIPSFMRHAVRKILDEHFSDADIYRVPDKTVLISCFRYIAETFRDLHCHQTYAQTLSYMQELGILDNDMQRTFRIRTDDDWRRTTDTLSGHILEQELRFLPDTYERTGMVTIGPLTSEKTGAIFDHFMQILPPALRTYNVKVHETKSNTCSYRPIHFFIANLKKGIYLNNSGQSREHVILHEYIHQLDFECSLPAEAVRTLIRMVKDHTTRRVLPAHEFGATMLEALSIPALSLISVLTKLFLFSTLSNVLLGLTLLSFTNLIFKALWYTKGKELVGQKVVDFPTKYSLNCQKEFISELLTTIILFGDAYRSLPQDSLLYRLYQLATDEIFEGITYTRDENMMVVQGPRTTDRPFRPRHEPNWRERLRRILD